MKFAGATARGRHRSRRFRDENAAGEFDESIHDHDVDERSKRSRHGQNGGVYPYETTSGTRWRYVTRTLRWELYE